MKIPFWQKVRIWTFGPIKVREEKRDGWSGKLPIYRFFCKDCGKFREDYLHGYTDRLDCPVCN